ncbi:unnamed protein product [Pelagomonas calceolata]|uniref:UV excision repair protein RAD23 n=1 Tax=Pelagomonas calceolata TaxID=35677 RepID=A0A8J2SQ80_9STRA|nr:unnamed protein product [Pelagomonas calceolata]
MIVQVKTLEGRLFKVEAAPEASIKAVKDIIETSQPELKAAMMKLIHSGKVLKDDETLADKGVTEQSFLVCMVTKPKRARPAPAPAPAPAPTPAAPAPAPAAAAPAPAPAATPQNDEFVSPEALAQLNAMGFGHEEQSRAALRAAMGNVDMAVEFLMNGIPEEQPSQNVEMTEAQAASPLAVLRSHPQFDELRRTIQANPASLQQVLQGLGREDPQLLQTIKDNQAEFLAMMNEPVQEAPAMGAGGDDLDAAQFARAMQSISPQQRAQLAATIGLTPEQFEQFSQQMQNMPREQLRQLLGALGGGGMPRGAGGGGGGGAPPQNVVRLTREEAEAVGRLCELGFSREDAAQAYLACDKNESLAANLLFDGFGGGGPTAVFPDSPAAAAPAPAAAAPAPASSDAAAPAPAPKPDDDDDMYS